MDKSQVARGFAWNVLFTVIGRIVMPIAIGIALARILGPANVGAFATLAAFTGVIDLVRDFGIGQNFITDRDADARGEAKYYALSLQVNAIIAVLLVVFTPQIALLLDLQCYASAVLVMALAALGSGIGIIPGAKLQKQARFRDFGVIEVVAQAIAGIVSLVLALNGVGVWALVWGVPARAWIGGILFYRAARMGCATPDRAFLKQQWSKFAATLSNSLMSTVYTIGDTALVGRMFGKESAGLYSTAFNIAMKPVELVSWPLGRTLLVAFSSYRDDRAKLANVYARALAAILFVVGPIFLLMAFYGREVAVLLYSETFAGSGPLLTIFTLYLFSRSLGTMSGALLVAVRKPWLSNFGWLAAFAILATGIATGQATGSVIAITWWFTSGAVVAFWATVAIVIGLVRPSPKDWTSTLKAVVANAVFALGCVGLARFELERTTQLGLGVLVLGPIYGLLAAGLISGRPFAVVSRSGLKELWHAI